MTRRLIKSHPIHFKALDAAAGVFEAYVSVFNNVDLGGDRIVPTAFDLSIEKWKASGDPLPVIFSHNWDDLNSYLGHIDPADGLEAVLAGDDRLPPELMEFGGLRAVLQMDTTEAPGRQAAKLLGNRTIKEFSFAYDITDEGRGDDGANELKVIDIIEAGPTLKGMNPLTQLAKAKSASAAAADPEAKAAPTPAGVKAWVEAPGSIEHHVEAVQAAVRAWAGELFGSDIYTSYSEATFTDNVLAYVELWDEPLGGGTFYQLSYTITDDDIEVSEAQAVDIELTFSPRRAAASAADPRTKLRGFDPAVGATESTPTDWKGSPPAVIRATVEAELLNLPE